MHLFFSVQKQLNDERQKLKALQRLESMGSQTDPLSTQSTSVGCDSLPKQSMSVGTDERSGDEGSRSGDKGSRSGSDTEDVCEEVSLEDLPVKYRGRALLFKQRL